MLRSNRLQSVSLLLAMISILSLGMTACGKGSKKNVAIPGVTGPNVSFINGKMTMTMVFQNATVDLGARISIPKAPNSYLELGPDLQSNGMLLAVGLDVNDIKALTGNGVTLLDPLTLPGGRPLPGVMDGYLPGFAVQVPKWNDVAFYFGSNVFGAFMPIDLGIQNLIATYRFYSDSGERIGNLSLVGQDANGKNSGFLILIDLKGTVGNLLATAN